MRVEGADALTRFFVGDATVADTLRFVLDAAVDAVPAADDAGITMLLDGHVTTALATAPLVGEIDAEQYESGDGPCLHAYRTGQIVVIPSTSDDERWPAFSAAALAHGIRSTLSLPLTLGDDRLGALNLYASAEGAFPDDVRAVAATVATQAAVVLANAQAYWDARSLNENLVEAMRSRATIEQAKGILMAGSPMSPDAAYDVLRMASQRENRKLRDIAQDIVARHSHDPGA